MKPSELKQLIRARRAAGIRRALLIESSPGTGKTSIPQQVAEEDKIGFICNHGPLMQPEDYGMPVVRPNKDGIDFIVPVGKFPFVGSDFPKEGILVCDELPQCDNSGQKIWANILQARELHGRKIMGGWSIIATGNRVGDRSGASRILSHLGDRVTRVELDVSTDDWFTWAIAHGVPTEIIAFLQFRPALLNNFDAQQDKYPTPRGWAEGVAAQLGKIPHNLELPVFKGDVGEGAAAEFLAFLKIYRNLPDLDDIIRNPRKTKVPTDPATLYALCGALAPRSDKETFDGIMTYINRMPPEFSVLFVNTVVKRNPEVQNTKAFAEWAEGPGAKLLA